MRLKEIKVGKKPAVPAGVPWKEAPCGPARVVDSDQSDYVTVTEVVLIVCEVSGNRRVLSARMWPELCSPFNEVRVEPLEGDVAFVFE